MSKFKKFLLIYVLILIVLTILASIYVLNTLNIYEDNQVENYMGNLIKDLKSDAEKNEIGKRLNNKEIEKSEFDRPDASVEKGLAELFKSDANIRFELNKNSKDEIKPVYDIYAGDNKILEVGLDGSDIETRLSLLTFSKWKVSYINVEAENGLFTCEVSAPSNYDVYVNDKKLTNDQISTSNANKGLTEISKYVEIPYAVSYEVKGLIEKPTYKIVDKNGNEVNENDIKVVDETKNYASEDEARSAIKEFPDIMQIAEDWSLFLSNDLSGSTHGFYQISEYLIEDSYLYNYAYDWATDVDITFISNHTLKNPAFTGEELTNFTSYNENAFSCDMYLEKNMRIANGNDLVDKMNERMYFAYYDDSNDGVDNPSWKLVNMQSITNNK